MSYRCVLCVNICPRPLRRGNGVKENCESLFQIALSLIFHIFPCFGDDAPEVQLVTMRSSGEILHNFVVYIAPCRHFIIFHSENKPNIFRQKRLVEQYF